jgi:hypothetical protein
MSGKAVGTESFAQMSLFLQSEAMPGGWVVAVYREGQGIQSRELWDCAIPNFADAQIAVRQACLPNKVVTRTDQVLSIAQVVLLGLVDGQVRKQQNCTSRVPRAGHARE